MSTEAEEIDLLESDLLAQTAQIVVQVREQLADVTRREQALHAQVATLEADRRGFRLERQQFDAETADSRAALEAKRQALALDADLLRQQKLELAQQNEAIDQQRQELVGERERLKAEAAAELDQERQDLQAAVVATSLEQIRLNDERAQFERQRLALVADFHRQRQSLEFALAAERQRLSEELTEASLSEKLRAERDQLNAERDRFQQTVNEWYAQQAEAKAELNRQHDLLLEKQQRVDDELSELRQKTLEEIDNERAEHSRTLQAERQQLVEEQQRAEVEFKKQQALTESRTRFQAERLDRSKEEIERAHDALRVEYQRARQRLEGLVELQRKQSCQLERRRTILEEYSESLRRQQECLARMQQSVESSAEHERQRLMAERQAWELKVQTLAAENRRQSDMVALHAENLESRRARLDQLREELEVRHRETLETRMAVDEAWAQLAQVTGDENAAQRVDASRKTLSEYYRALREGMETQRQEVADARQLFEQQKTEFRSEQQTFTDWVAQREQQLRRQEDQLQSQLAQVADQEKSWQKARDTWLSERLEAERIIRQLLSELSVSIDTASGTRVTELPEMPSLLGLARFLDNAA